MIYEAKHAQYTRKALTNVPRQATCGVHERGWSRTTSTREKCQFDHKRPCHDLHAHKGDDNGNLRAFGPFGKQECGKHLAQHEYLVEARERDAAMQQDTRNHDDHAREHGRNGSLPGKIIKWGTGLGKRGPNGKYVMPIAASTRAGMASSVTLTSFASGTGIPSAGPSDAGERTGCTTRTNTARGNNVSTTHTICKPISAITVLPR